MSALLDDESRDVLGREILRRDFSMKPSRKIFLQIQVIFGRWSFSSGFASS
jgi:hypothetical protein